VDLILGSCWGEEALTDFPFWHASDCWLKDCRYCGASEIFLKAGNGRCPYRSYQDCASIEKCAVSGIVG
jgi:hypothetical protein